MSKVRRPRPPRHGAKPSPIPAQAAPSGAKGPVRDPAAEHAPEPAVTAPEAAGFTAADEVAAEPAIAALTDGPEIAEPVAMAFEGETEPAEAGSESLPVPLTAPTPFLSEPVSPRLGAESFGMTVMNYVIAEGEAFAAHMRALSGARSMGEIVRLQIGEVQRAANASLSCWGVLTLTASRTVATR